MWSRRGPRHVWDHVSHVHGSCTLILTETASVHMWVVKNRGLCHRNKVGDESREGRPFDLLSTPAPLWCIKGFISGFSCISFIARSYRKFRLQTCIFGIGSVGFFSTIFAQKYRKNQNMMLKLQWKCFSFLVILSGITITNCWSHHWWPFFSSRDAVEGFYPACPWWENVQLNDIWLPGA